jgi:2-dehydropantoate 2-reductase
MRLAVVGSGGVGGYFGGRLAAAGVDVAFLARGAHLDALRRKGLTVQSPLGDFHLSHVTATNQPAEIGPVDVVFFTVKLYDTESALALLQPLVDSSTVVIPFQNGVESVDVLAGTVGREHVAGGTAFVSAVITEPGVLRHTVNDRLVFGELDGSRSSRLERLLDACTAARFQARLSDRIDVDIWSKFVWLTVFSGITAVTRLPVGALRDDPDIIAMCQAAALEAIAVARAKGIPLPPTMLDEMMKGFQELPPQTKSSMLEDLERGRRLELPWLSGAVLRLAEDVGLQAPTHRFIATALKPYVDGRRA